MLSRTPKSVPLVSLLVFALLQGLGATASTVGGSKVVDVRVLMGQVGARPGSDILLGLQLRMKPGWHTYWQNPGDSGQPTTWAVRGPEGTMAGPVRWPTPERLPAGPLMSYGYKTETVLLREVRIPKNLAPGTNLSLISDVTWLECADVCLPGKARLRLEIPIQAGAGPDRAHQNLLLSYEKRVPKPLPPAWTWEPKFSSTQVSFVLRKAGSLDPVYFFPAPGVRLAFAEAQVFSREGNDLRATLRPDPAAGPITALAGVLVFRTGEGLHAYRLQPEDASDGLNLWGALLFAFIGGLVLNLMPCVLPVLSIKVQGLLLRSGESRAQSMLHGGMLTAGVLGSFWLMAGAILFARAGGESLGWGFQLQSPPIVTALAAVMLLFALNLMGVFEVGTTIQKAGARGGSSGLWGSFLTGVLAVVVAAPCTAPFMGAAIGFAVVQPALVALGVFTALGLGLAFPYILLSAFPNLLRFLPRQGAWMDTLKKSMGFLLATAVAWLVWLLGRLSGVDAIGFLLGALLVLAAAAWLYGHAVQNPTASTRARRMAGGIALLLAALGLYLGTLAARLQAAPGPQTSSSPSHIQWEPFSPARLSALRAEGEPVFLDFTADWCLSCKVNERTSLETEAVGRQMKKLGVTAMRADWTRRDPVITGAIQSFGRSGVPLYAVYPRGKVRSAFLLPEVLTESIVLRALERAGRMP